VQKRTKVRQKAHAHLEEPGRKIDEEQEETMNVLIFVDIDLSSFTTDVIKEHIVLSATPYDDEEALVYSPCFMIYVQTN
jgi:hypothetical protein